MNLEKMYVCFPCEEIEWKSKSKRHGLKLNVLHFGSAMAGWYIVMTMTGRLYQRSTFVAVVRATKQKWIKDRMFGCRRTSFGCWKNFVIVTMTSILECVPTLCGGRKRKSWFARPPPPVFHPQTVAMAIDCDDVECRVTGNWKNSVRFFFKGAQKGCVCVLSFLLILLWFASLLIFHSLNNNQIIFFRPFKIFQWYS